MTTATTSDALHNGLFSLEFGRGMLNNLLEDFPADKRLAQPIEDCNHLMWIIGHLAWADDGLLAIASGGEGTSPAEWKELFGMGSSPRADGAGYPSYEELKDALDANRKTLVDWYKSRNDEQLAEPLSEEMQQFAPTVGAMMGTMAAHEALHVGQISMLRRAFGMPPKLG